MIETAPPPAGRFYRPELDVVRIIAFLLVFLSHALPKNDDLRTHGLVHGPTPLYDASVAACGFGLCLFFTLSAFLICELLLRERSSAGTVAVKQFYIRRVLRIWPLYYLALALGLIVAFMPGAHRGEVGNFIWYAVFLGAWHSSLYGWIKNPIAPLWSISVEEQFYLFAPWIVKYFSRRSLFVFCAVLIVNASAWLYYLGSFKASSARVWADSFVSFECFAGGILLCLILGGRAPALVLWQRLMLLTACCACWITASYGLHFFFLDAPDNPGSWPLIGGYALAALGSILMLVAFLGIDAKLLPRWAIYLGRISFGLYVYHQFALIFLRHLPVDAALADPRIDTTLKIVLTVALRLALPFCLTLLAAATSYRYFESAFLRMKRRHTVIESDPREVNPFRMNQTRQLIPDKVLGNTSSCAKLES